MFHLVLAARDDAAVRQSPQMPESGQARAGRCLISRETFRFQMF